MEAGEESYYNDLDDLFGGHEVSSQYPEPPTNNNYYNNNTSTVNEPPMSMPLPLPMPLPMPLSTESQPLPLPMPAVDVTDTKTCQEFEDQLHDAWNGMEPSRSQGPEKQADLSVLFEQFLAQQAAGAGAAPASSLYANCQVALPTQLQPKANPPPAGAKISHSRNKNGDYRIGRFDWYDTPPTRKSWMAVDGDRQVPIKYTKKGELRQPATLGRGDIEAYVRGCAARGIPLRLWVQNIPTIHTDRYHHADHHKCRIKGCAAKGTLGRGAYQVCFDEYSTETSNGRFDPFHVAVYMHLFCLEELIPMAHLMEFADVQPDVRELPLEERNPMSLRRDGSHVLENIFYEWKKKHHDAYIQTGIPICKTPRKTDSDCLYYNLTKKKLESQPSTRQKMRDKRNGNDISKHYGNLRKEEANRNASKKKRKLARFCSDSSSVVELVDVSNMATLNKYPFTPAPEPSPKRQRLSDCTRPALQTAAAHAMQSQQSTYAPSPLRRSRRLSGTHAVDQITIPATSAYTAPAPKTARSSRRSLNVQTDNMSLALDNISYTPNIDGLVYDFTNAYDQYIDQELSNLMPLTNANANASSHVLHFGQVSTPGGTYEVTTAPVPYGLRATPARRETAIKQTSARISMTEGIRCDEKRLIEAVKSPGIPMKTPTILPRASRSHRTASQHQQGNHASHASHAAALSSPSRRVTRSMSRNGSAVEAPSEHAYNWELDFLYPQDLDAFADGFFDMEAFSQ